MSPDHLVKLGTLFLLLVPGCGAAGHFFGGLLALALGKDEELWMRRGEIIVGCIGVGGFAGAAWAILH